jgi:hypothetical protein
VVPIHFIGANSNHFYRFANICKMLHLKFNFAMLLLPDEMYRNRHRSYTVRIGKTHSLADVRCVEKPLPNGHNM